MNQLVSQIERLNHLLAGAGDWPCVRAAAHRPAVRQGQGCVCH